MSASIASTFFATSYAQTLAQTMEENQAELLVLTPEQYLSILQDKARHDPQLDASIGKALSQTSLGKYWGQTFYPNLGNPATVPLSLAGNDLYMIGRTMVALGVVGTQCYSKVVNGRTYIIFKGRAGLRNALKGTRYLATNPQVVQLGLGVKGAQNVAKGGFILGLVVSVGIEVTDFIFNDEKTMYDLVGGIGVEAVKGGLTSLVAYGVGIKVGMALGLAVAPLGVMIGVALIVGVALNALDSNYKIKEKTIAVLKAAPSTLQEGVYRIQQESLSWFESLRNELGQGAASLREQGGRIIGNVVDGVVDASVDALQRRAAEMFHSLISPRIR